MKLTSELGAPDQGKERAETAAMLAAQLSAQTEKKDDKGKVSKVAEHSTKSRNQIARYLASVGGDAEVPALKQSLEDFEVREMARWALSRMTCQAATDALIAVATGGIGNEFRVGVINALGTRQASAPSRRP